MNRNIEKALKILNKKENKLLNKTIKDNAIKGKIYKKIPDKLINTLEAAFVKAFEMIFIKGTLVIEKTFNKENISLEFQENDSILNKKISKQNIKRLDKKSQKSNLINSTLTTSCGAGLGFLGMGLPDIPILVGTILNGIYKIALSYGFSYETNDEKIYIVRLIRVALSSGNSKKIYNKQLDSLNYGNTNLEEEIILTAKVLSNELLVEKFVQGLPIIGVVGAFVNNIVYNKIAKLCVIKYKKRYLENLSQGSVH